MNGFENLTSAVHKPASTGHLVLRPYYSLLKRTVKALRSYCSGAPDFILADKTITVLPGTFIDKNSAVGSYTYIGRSCNISRTHIGRYCSIANNVSIGQGEHDLSRISTSSIFYQNAYDELTKNPCEIGNDVWIGVDAIIRRNVTIGDGAVIGANSVVTKDVPAFAIVAGVPAKLLRYRFEPHVIELIRQSGWWQFDLDSASEIIQRITIEAGQTLS